MFGHLYKYRLKAFLHSKEMVFWVMLFPILLVSCFYVAFSSIADKAYTFHSIPVAVVFEKDDAIFETTLDSVASSDNEGEEFLKVTKTDMASAKELLRDGDIDAIIDVTDTVSMIIDENGLNQTAVSSFINQYLQTITVIQDITADNPDALGSLMTQMATEVDSIKQSNFTDKKVDPLASYYFALIGMAALFGGFFGLECAEQLKANLSGVGMRKCLSPVRKTTIVVADYLAAFTLQMISLIILLIYMMLVLRIDLGGQLGYLLLTCAVGGLFGISSGIFIGSLRVSQGLRNSIFLTFSLGSSFLSGLMFADMKIVIQHKAPIINMLNPGTLIQDALYSLLIYNTHERYFTNMIILAIMTVVLTAVSIIMTRRESYASL